jgi:transketolase
MGTLMSIPEITLVEPTDTAQLRWLIKELQNSYGVYYIRMMRKLATGVFEEGSEFDLKKIAVLKEGTDVAIVASGIMVGEALKAAESLEKQGISAAVLNAFVWKPLDGETLAKYSKQCGCVVTAENHNKIGGLFSAVADFLAVNRPTPVEYVAVEDVFGEVGAQPYLEKQFNLTTEHIVEKVKKVVGRK